MEINQAKKLIRRVFESAFDLDTYKQFLSELLVNIDASTELSYITGGQIHEKFRNTIASYMIIAKYKTVDKTIDLLVVKLKDHINLDRNRSSLRNFIMHYLNSVSDFVILDAALVAFVEPNSSRWRFSLMCLDKLINITDKGNITTTEKFTSVKRYSFILGEKEPSHTAQQQFLPFLEHNKEKPTLRDLETIFAVEKLSDEFFDNYIELLSKTKTAIVTAAKGSKFYQVHKEIIDEKKNIIKYFLIHDKARIDVGNFAKKLLGQIVFLYFLQKKGWLGVAKDKAWGAGNKGFMRDVFNEKSLNRNYFNQFLEPLFYEALSSQRDQDYFTLLDCKIPFLNGGLFERDPVYDWTNHKLELPNSLFSNDETIRTTKNSIEIVGTGILDVFDRYNFTVCEDEPLEKEVAIDPEMLGKIFENTIEENERKGKGAFYTPRLIVYYMVKQSLIEYLASKLNSINSDVSNSDNKVSYADLEKLVNHAEFYLENEAQIASKGEGKNYKREVPEPIAVNSVKIDKLLADITILDPAVGSGAYPVGLLIELVKIRQLLQIYTKQNKSAYELKHHAIVESIYGVDIDAGAIDVARLRLWLSLIVDELDFENVQPLPNLDYKLIVGNSLSRINPQDLFIEEKTRKLAELENIYINESQIKNKRKLKEQIDEQLAEIMQGSFDFRYVFGKYREGDGFDIVIGNPPYVCEEGNRDNFRKIKESIIGQLYYKGKMDLFYFFFHIGLDALKNKGILSFITTNYFITATGADTLRKDFMNRTSIIQLINFNELKIFKSAQGQHNMITILQKANMERIAKITITDRMGHACDAMIKLILNKSDDKTKYFEKFQNELYANGNIVLSDDKLDKIIAKISQSNTYLDAFFSITNGVQTGANKVTENLLNKVKKLYPTIDLSEFSEGDGIFILNDQQLGSLNLTENESGLIKKWYKSSDICHFNYHSYKQEYLIYIFNGHNIANFPNINKHLSKYRKLLNTREQTTDKAGGWFWIRGHKNDVFQAGEFLICPYRSKKNIFAYSKGDFYSGTDVYYLTLKKKNTSNYKYFLGLLNSAVIFFWLYHRGKRKGEMLELMQEPLLCIPVPIINNQRKQQLCNEISTLSDEIISVIGEEKLNSRVTTKVNTLQKKIDLLVYELYDLDLNEISIIEGLK